MEKIGYSKEDIYSGFAKFDNPATFYFKPKSEAYHEFGKYVTGVVRYTKEERETLEENSDNGIDTYGTIKLQCANFHLTEEQKALLLNKGFECKEIAKISASFFNKTDKFHDASLREIPNIMGVSVDLSDVKPGSIFVNHMFYKMRRGHKLLPEERNKLLGILMAHNDGALPEFLISHFNLTDEKIINETSLWRHYFSTKEKISGLDELEQQAYDVIEANRSIYRAQLIDEEVSKYNNGKGLKDVSKDVITLLFEKTQKFQPTRLLQIRIPVYWDFESFIHIYLRHVKETQIGDFFKSKSNFQYDYEAIEKLIVKVLQEEKKAIEQHFKQNKDKKFYRAGKMGVYYNGDYYSFDISSEGRLESFYKMG